MATLKARIERLERERRFKTWVRMQRILESLTDEQLEDIRAYGRWPEPLPEPAPGVSRLDALDRKALLKLWEDHELVWAGRSGEEMEFFIKHGHWPDEPCDEINLCREVQKEGRLA